MRCEDLARQISQLADSGQNSEAATELAEHLRACPACFRQWQAVQEAESVLARASMLAPSADFRQRVMASVACERARIAAQQNPARRSPRLAAAAAGVALVFVATGVLVIGTSLAWNLDTLVRLAAQSLVLAFVELSGALVSVDALIRAVSVIWGALPAPAGQVVLCAAGLGAFAVISSWAWLVSRYGWGARLSSA